MIQKSIKILVLCTANSCRSQMASAFLASFDSRLYVKSAGTAPALAVHPLTVKAMKEVGFDISKCTPTDVGKYVREPWDYLITVCDVAKYDCPTFVGSVGNKIHYRFDDPMAYAFDDGPKLFTLFQEVRNLIHEEMSDFYETFILKRKTN